MKKPIMLDKTMIYTFLGRFKPNEFTTIDGITYPCCTYRRNHEEIGREQLCAVNLEWMEEIMDWVITRYILLNDVSFSTSNRAENTTNVVEQE